MGQELRRGTKRIIANYARLLTTLVFGIAVVPLTIRWLGDDAFGIISLLGANIGLAGIFRQIIQMSLVRELGHGYHASDASVFRRSYATICLITLICAVLSVVSFAIVFLLIPVFRIPPEFLGAARWFVFGQGLYTLVLVLTAPMFNMYLVMERFVEYNFWYVLVRLGNLISVVILGYAIVIDDPVRGLALHGMTWAGLASAALVVASLIMVIRERRLIPTLRGADKDTRDQVVSTFSWNTAVQVAMNLHEQIPPVLLNLFGGTLANAAWGVGFRFVAYIRMCTTGIQFGSDAVSARLASGADDDESRTKLQQLIGVQTKLTSVIALPAALVIFVYGWPIFHVWVGHSLRDYNAVMPVAVFMSKVLSIALLSRAISETWLLILYGAGYVKVYAPWIFAGGIIAPVSSLVLMLLLPDHLVVYAPPMMFAIVLFIVHLLGLPLIVGRCLHISPASLLRSLVRPVVASLLAMGVAVLVMTFGGSLSDLGFHTNMTRESGGEIDYVWIVISLVSFSLVYSLLTALFVLTADERNRFIGLVKRRKAA
jgi:O-antigen/teichoic acid export membrane protein